MPVQRRDHQVALPHRETILLDADQIRNADGWYPHESRLLVAIVPPLRMAQRPRRGTIVGAVSHKRPAVVGPADDQVEFVAALRPVLGTPDGSLGSHVKTLGIAMP